MADEITRKRHDTLDPFSGRARLNAAPVDLTVFDTIELHYRLKVNPTEVVKLPVVDVETVDGPGGADVEDPPGSGNMAPPNRGRWRALPADADVDIEGAYEMELECVLGTRKVHIPNSRAANPTLNLDEDEDDA